jgi:hypothetical protein
MPRRRTQQTTGSGSQMDLALKLRMAEPFFEQSGKSHEWLSWQRRAFYMSQKACAELAKTDQKTNEQRRKMLIYQLNHLLMALSPNVSDPQTLDAKIRISKCLSKLYELDGKAQIEPIPPDIEPTEPEPDLSKLTVEELRQMLALLEKAGGLPRGFPGLIDSYRISQEQMQLKTNTNEPHKAATDHVQIC